jgi:ectoine hydroxylase
MALSDSDVESFHRDGILFFPSLLTPQDIEVVRSELPDVLAQERPEILREKHTGHVRCAFAPHTYNPTFERLMRHPSIVERVKQLLGGDVYLHQFSINPKAPFEGEAWGWHQDYATWFEENRMPTPRVVNVGVFLDDVTEFNGPLFFVLGSHTHGAMQTHLDDKSTSYSLLGVDNATVAKLSESGSLFSPKGPAGSVWIFHGNIVHASNANISPLRRALCTICYNRVDNLPSEFPRSDWEAHANFAPIESLATDCLHKIN